MKEIKDERNRWRKISCSLDWKNQYCENDYTTPNNIQVQYNPYQITNGIFYRTRIKKFTIFMEHKRSWQAKEILRKKTRAGGISLSDLRLYDKATIIKTVWYWHKRNTDQCNERESTEIDTSTYGYLIFDKDGKEISSISGAGKTGHLHVKE